MVVLLLLNGVKYGFKEPLHGNSAITLWSCAGVVIRNCEISNAYFRYVWGGIEGGIFAISNAEGIESQNNISMTGFGQTGNHIIENNRIHDSWGVFSSRPGIRAQLSVIIFYENHHTSSVKDLMPSF